MTRHLHPAFPKQRHALHVIIIQSFFLQTENVCKKIERLGLATHECLYIFLV